MGFLSDWLSGKGNGRPDLKEIMAKEGPDPVCKYCGGKEFFEGPSGGLSTNILCTNYECRHWFNYSPVLETLEDLHRQEPTKEEKIKEIERLTDTVKTNGGFVKIDVIYQEGKDLFEKGDSALACLQQNTEGDYCATQSDIIRMAGYIDAFVKYIKSNNARLDEQINALEVIKPPTRKFLTMIEDYWLPKNK